MRFSPIIYSLLGILSLNCSVQGQDAEAKPQADAVEQPTDNAPELPSSDTIQAVSPEEQKMSELLSLWLKEQDQWSDSLNKATTVEERQLILQSPPDGAKTTQQVWNLIRKNFDQEWTLLGIAWLIENLHELDKFPQEQVKDIKRTLFDAVEHKWVANPKVKEVCPSLLRSPEMRALAILEKIIRINKNPATKGHAALAIALKMRSTPGADDPKSVATRGGYIKYALMNITGADFGGDFGGMKIEKIIQDELFALNNLTMNQKSPEIKGSSIQGEEINAQSIAGKTTVFLFVDPQLPDIGNIVKRVNYVSELYKAEPFKMVLIMPGNNDSLKQWAEQMKVSVPIIADTDWSLHQLYQVNKPALAFVLDKEGKINFKNVPNKIMEMTIKELVQPVPAS